MLGASCVPSHALPPHPPSAHPGTTKAVLRRDGFKGLYRGLGPTILGYLPTWAIYFAVYDGIKSRLANDQPPLTESLRQGVLYPAPTPKGYQPHAREHPWSVHLLSAMAAGATSTIATNPLWVIKTRFMVRFAMGCVKLLMSMTGGFIEPDAIRERGPLPPHTRRLPHHLPHRGRPRLLPRACPQPARHLPRRRPVPALRATKAPRACVPHPPSPYCKHSHLLQADRTTPRPPA